MSFLSVPVSLFATRARKIGDIKVDVIIQESTNDTLTITKQPVQQGASISDHAYKEPTALSMSILFRDNLTKSLSKIYADLLKLQIAREPFFVTTPKRIYSNMLISSLGQTTEKGTENCLAISIQFQEVILVPVSTTTVPRAAQKNPGNTAATQKAGRKQSGLDALISGPLVPGT